MNQFYSLLRSGQRQTPLRPRFTWIVLAAAALSLGPSLLAQPSNDHFADCIALTGTNVTLQGTTVGATQEGLEPYEHTVWWQWTASADGRVMLTRENGDAGSESTVFTGAVLADLQTVTPDWSFAGTVFPVFAGAAYQLAVGSSNEVPIDLKLRFVPHPPNESFASRIHLGNGDLRVTGTLGTSTNLPSGPTGIIRWPTLWYSWTATASGAVTMSLDVDQGVVWGPPAPYASVNVYIGEREDQLKPVSFSRGGDAFGQQFAAETGFMAEAGTTYQVSVGGAQFPGDFTLSVVQHAAPSGLLVEPAAGAVFHVGDTIPLRALAFNPEGRVGQVEFYQALKGPYDSGEMPKFYAPIDSTTSWPFATSWKPEAPGAFFLAARTEDQFGARRCSPPSVVQVRPANDDFAARMVLKGASLTVTGYCGNATREPGEPESSGVGSAWWSWTAPDTGAVTLRAESGYTIAIFRGSDVTNLTWIADSTSCGNNPGLPAVQLVFSAVAGTTYQIAVSAASQWSGPNPFHLSLTPSLPPTIHFTSLTNDTTLLAGPGFDVQVDVVPGGAAIERVEFYSYGSLFGWRTNAPYSLTIPTPEVLDWGNTYDFQVRVVDALGLEAWTDEIYVFVRPPPPANDNFADRLVLTGTSWIANGSSTSATTEPGEPPPGNSAWWSWTAPVSGTYTIIDTNVYDQMTVFSGSTLSNLTPVAASANLNGAPAVVFQASAGTTYVLAVSGGGATQFRIIPSAPPTISFLEPTNNLEVISGQPFRLEVAAADSDGMVTNVEFYIWEGNVGPRRLGGASQPPYGITVSLTATNWQGNFVWAYATDDHGLVAGSGVSVVVHPPAATNDSFANRIPLQGPLVEASGTTEYATREPGEPDDNQGSVWWTWTAPASGPTTIQLSHGGAYVTVFEGDAISNLTQIARLVDPNWWPPGWVRFNAQAGKSYQISVASSGAPVAFRLAMSQPPSIALRSPTNGTLVLSGTSVTLEAEAADPEGALSRVDFYVNDRLAGSVTNPPYRMNFQPGFWPRGYTCRAIATDAQGLSTASDQSSFSVVPLPAPNDDFAHRLPLSGFLVSAGWENASYTNGTAWWTWRAPASGAVTAAVRDWSGQRLQIYTGAGPEVTDLTLTGESLTGELTFHAAAGATHQIAAEHCLYYPSLWVDLALDSPEGAVMDPVAFDASGDLHLKVTTLSEQPWVLLVSTNLVDWTTIRTNTAGNQVFEFVDPKASSYPVRFYRLSAQGGGVGN